MQKGTNFDGTKKVTTKSKKMNKTLTRKSSKLFGNDKDDEDDEDDNTKEEEHFCNVCKVKLTQYKTYLWKCSKCNGGFSFV